MKIGIDLTPLQGAHRMRGIGYTVMNIVNNLPEIARHEHTFVFYMVTPQQKEALSLLNLSGLSYEIREVISPKPLTNLRRRNWLLKKSLGVLRTGWTLVIGNSQGAHYRDLDWFLQFDQSKPLPSRLHVKSAVVLYDLIPYVLEHLYLRRYSTARHNGASRKRAVLSHLKRLAYITKVRLTARRAAKLIAISEHTKQDFVRFAGVKASKIEVCLLGIPTDPLMDTDTPKHLRRFIASSWGPVAQIVPLPDKPFVLFVGGADSRRKLVELVAAFNNLRAQGHDICLILSGDTMLGPNRVGSAELHEYLQDCAYIDDIYFLGFTDDQTREWLYKNTLAFVWPSIYEGFGLPILEALRYGTQVITYDNSSIREVGKSYVSYAKDFHDISEQVAQLLQTPKKPTTDSRKYAQKFTWKRTAECYMKLLS